VRDLTPSEYRTVLVLLARSAATDRERIRESGLPSSTYNVVRRRAFEEGWLTRLVVPNPVPCGFGGMTILLARPVGSDREGFVRDLARDPECVLLWSGLHAVFGVFFGDGTESSRFGSDGGSARDPAVASVRVDASRGSVIAYFDYSGLWARFGGQPPPPAYPAGLDARAGSVDARALVDGQRLIRASEDGPYESRAWPGIGRLWRQHPRATQGGVVQDRTVLNPVRLPPFQGRRIAEVILVRGRLRPLASAARLLNALTGDCGVFPFLVAESGGEVVLAGVGQTSARSTGRQPVASARQPVLASLTRHLDPVDVMIEPVEAIEERVQHRYPDRFPALARARSTGGVT